MVVAPPRVGAAMPAYPQRRSSAGHAPARLGCSDSWGVGVSRSWASSDRAKPTALAVRNRDVETKPRGKICEPTEPILGAEIRVWWSAEGQWFDGVVDGKRMEQKRGRWIHHVTYTDGDDRWHHLPSMDWTAQLATNPKRAEAVMAAKRKSRPLHSSRPVKVTRRAELSSVESSHVAPDAATAVEGATPRTIAPKCRRRRLVREARRRVRRARGDAVQVKEDESLHEDATSLLALRSRTMAAATEGPVPRCVERARRALVSRESFEQLGAPSMLAGSSLLQQVVRFERTGIEAFVEAYDPVDGLHTLSASGRSWREALVGKCAVAFTRVPSPRAHLPSPPIVVEGVEFKEGARPRLNSMTLLQGGAGVHVPTEFEFVEAPHRTSEGEPKEQCQRQLQCSRDAGHKGFCNKCRVAATGQSTAVRPVDMVACMSLLLLRSVF